MAKFTTRVELHTARSESDYEILHTAMHGEGFSRFITDENGGKRRIPTAEYNYEGNLTKSEVLAAAKRAATSTHHTFWILVTESNGRTWDNLPLI